MSILARLYRKNVTSVGVHALFCVKGIINLIMYKILFWRA